MPIGHIEYPAFTPAYRGSNGSTNFRSDAGFNANCALIHKQKLSVRAWMRPPLSREAVHQESQFLGGSIPDPLQLLTVSYRPRPDNKKVASDG